jgi:hypothetical protein
MLHPGRLVEVEVLLDLTLLLAFSRFVDRELDHSPSTLHDLRHQRGVLGGDGIVIEVLQHRERKDPLVELHPFVHLAEFDVRNDMIDRVEARAACDRVRARLEPWVWAFTLDQRMDSVPICLDRGDHHSTALVLDYLRWVMRRCTVFKRHGIGSACIGNGKPDVSQSWPVELDVFGDLVVSILGTGHDELDLVGSQQIGGAVGHTCLWPPVSDDLKPEECPERLCRHKGVANPPLRWAKALHREWIFRRELSGS